ncbi:MAG: hypothetical protein A2Z15_02260 [Chloroflexi bacterium RBG_16_50_11]|nr:MAG: hypothetical protein A2Z15_02260 [Chloroflexi bacterium RBG_16_50_11]
MEAGKPSKTAVFAAMTRAAHLFLDGEPKILRDDFALKFCGMKDELALKSALNAFYRDMGQKSSPVAANNFSQSYRAFAVVRHRYTEDELTKALERGVSQYVILGAGLDSFAYRRRDLENKLRVFEVDHPAMQQWKKTRLKELNISPPRNLTFVPVDFEKQKMTDELCAYGYRKDVSAFFSMLGVAPYLTEEAVFQTLREVASMAPESEIIFEYVLLDSLLNDEDRKVVAGGKERGREELWLSQFAPILLMQQLKKIGFTEARDFGPEEASKLYFTGRTDELSPSALGSLSSSILRIAHLMKARV